MGAETDSMQTVTNVAVNLLKHFSEVVSSAKSELTKLRQNCVRYSSVIVNDNSRLNSSDELLCVHLLLTATYCHLYRQTTTVIHLPVNQSKQVNTAPQVISKLVSRSSQ